MKERVRVAQSLESRECAQATRIHAPNVEKISFILCLDLRFYLQNLFSFVYLTNGRNTHS